MLELVSRAAKSLKPHTVDEPAGIKAEIERTVQAAELARAAQERLLAAHDAELDDEKAEDLLRRSRDQGRAVKRAEKDAQDLRERLAAVQRREIEQKFAKHKMLISTAARRNIEAQTAAAAANVASIDAFTAARVDLGSIAERLIPRVNFAGIPLPDLVAMWEKEVNRNLSILDRAEFPPRSAPVAAAPVAQVEHYVAPRRVAQPGGASPAKKPAEPVAAPRHETAAPRPARLDPLPTDDQHQAVLFMRGDVDLDGFQTQRGDRLTLPTKQARALVTNGAAEFYVGEPEGEKA
jgi:hypothetical protein